jgi:hypothetical protein
MDWLKKKAMSSMGIVGIVVSVVVVVALIPVIANSIAGATNLTASERTILGLTTTLIVLGLVVLVARKAGLGKG